MNMTYVQLLPNDSSVNGNVHHLIIYVQMRRHLAGDQVERSAGSLLQRKTVQLPTTLHEPPAAYVRQSSESRRKGEHDNAGRAFHVAFGSPVEDFERANISHEERYALHPDQTAESREGRETANRQVA